MILKKSLFLIVALLLISMQIGFSAPRPDPDDVKGISSLNEWSGSMGWEPKPEKEEKPSPAQIEIDRWSWLTQTPTADYRYEDSSIFLDPPDRHSQYINVQRFPTTRSERQPLTEKYASKCEPKDSFSHFEYLYLINRKTKKFAIVRTRVCSFGFKIIEETEVPLEKATWTPISEDKDNIAQLCLNKVDEIYRELQEEERQNR